MRVDQLISQQGTLRNETDWRTRALSVVALAFALAACGGGIDGSVSNVVEMTPEPVSSSAWGRTPLSIAPEVAESSPDDPLAATEPPPTHTAVDAQALNSAPSIEGEPSKAVVINTYFAFEPSAFDPDGDVLTFDIVNLPSWAAFDALTGTITGTPDIADVGYYDEISISVTDGYASTTLKTFAVDVVAAAHGTITVSLAPPTEREDGSAFEEISGYRIYWGTEEGNYPDSATLSQSGIIAHVIDGLLPETYYIVATVIDSEGVESDFSAPVEFTVN